MEKIFFTETINAPISKVYKTMLDPQGYRQWTTPFNEASRFVGTWEEGSTMQFLGENKEGKVDGLIGRIKQNIPNEVVAIEHIGMVDGKTETTSGPVVENWIGAMEIYRFRETNGKTVVDIEMDTTSDFRSYMEKTWPPALQKLKEICE